MKKIILLILIIFNLTVFAHPWKPDKYVVIDTDGGIDDYRTLCLLLSSPNIRILAITASAGVLDAEITAVKVKALLNSLHHEGIPVAVDKKTKIKGKNCKSAVDLIWGDENSVKPTDFITVDSLADYLSNECKFKIEFINLGSLSTINRLINEKSQFTKLISRIIWSSRAVFPMQGFNYEIDTLAYFSLSKHLIPINIIHGEGEYSKTFIDSFPKIQGLHAQKLSKSFSEDITKSPFGMKTFDELTVIYLHFPERFLKDSVNNFFLYKITNDSVNNINNCIFDILKKNKLYSNQIIKQLPFDTAFYQYDVQFLMKEIIDKHGVTEWNVATTTFEMHRHIGIYALIGAKMGIRAREYFGAGVDEMKVLSFAGSKPPVSCMNDGIQVSTGATLGHGLIKINDDNTLPAAEFTYLNRTIKIELKDKYKQKIAEEIKQLIIEYGLNNDKYWDSVRENTIFYWLLLSRFEIFEINEIRN